MADNVIDLVQAHAVRQQRTREAEQQHLEQAARLVLAAVELVGPAPTGRLAAAFLRRL